MTKHTKILKFAKLSCMKVVERHLEGIVSDLYKLHNQIMTGISNISHNCENLSQEKILKATSALLTANYLFAQEQNRVFADLQQLTNQVTHYYFRTVKGISKCPKSYFAKLGCPNNNNDYTMQSTQKLKINQLLSVIKSDALFDDLHSIIKQLSNTLTIVREIGNGDITLLMGSINQSNIQNVEASTKVFENCLKVLKFYSTTQYNQNDNKQENNINCLNTENSNLKINTKTNTTFNKLNASIDEDIEIDDDDNSQLKLDSIEQVDRNSIVDIKLDDINEVDDYDSVINDMKGSDSYHENSDHDMSFVRKLDNDNGNKEIPLNDIQNEKLVDNCSYHNNKIDPINEVSINDNEHESKVAGDNSDFMQYNI